MCALRQLPVGVCERHPAAFSGLAADELELHFSEVCGSRSTWRDSSSGVEEKQRAGAVATSTGDAARFYAVRCQFVPGNCEAAFPGCAKEQSSPGTISQWEEGESRR